MVVNKDNRIVACIDRDTKDELGSPDIRDSIFSKINHSKFFVCDISLNENGVPNPNVIDSLLHLMTLQITLGSSKNQGGHHNDIR